MGNNIALINSARDELNYKLLHIFRRYLLTFKFMYSSSPDDFLINPKSLVWVNANIKFWLGNSYSPEKKRIRATELMYNVAASSSLRSRSDILEGTC